MQDNFDTINLEYVETRRVSLFAKLIAIWLSFMFVCVPMYEFISGLKQESFVCTYGIVSTCGCIIGF
ncbi:hypothetical protein AAY42_10895 [Flagellimonas eckloniae]|uniref:Uncharacterized protein n=1 Tax=Flagellimonas eckloniae TaxID=346185 RepID=A0A0Q1H9G5_9FLAO|nr:hypothetical protein AAY42_10895 [Allomuricauda eckloniae]